VACHILHGATAGGACARDQLLKELIPAHIVIMPKNAILPDPTRVRLSLFTSVLSFLTLDRT